MITYKKGNVYQVGIVEAGRVAKTFINTDVQFNKRNGLYHLGWALVELRYKVFIKKREEILKLTNHNYQIIRIRGHPIKLY